MDFWNAVFVNPILNGIVWLSGVLGGNLGLSIIVVTAIVNLILLPLTIRQIRSSLQFQEIQQKLAPKIKKLQKKYGQDRRKLQEELAKLYREHGVSPTSGCLGSLLPLLIQFPIWIALYRSIFYVLAPTPESLIALSYHLYHSSSLFSLLPLESKFLWFDLGSPDIPLTLLVMGATWGLQKISTAKALDPQQRSTQRLMEIITPLFIGLICFYIPSALALYILVVDIFRMVVQYLVMRGERVKTALLKRAPSLQVPAMLKVRFLQKVRINPVGEKDHGGDEEH